MNIIDALKAKLNPEFINKILDENSHSGKFTDFYRLTTAFELAILDAAYEWSVKNKRKASDALVLNRTTFLEKLKKFRG